ncbi:MAG: NfeD family protein [Candidatus Binataceae bacterium]
MKRTSYRFPQIIAIVAIALGGITAAAICASSVPAAAPINSRPAVELIDVDATINGAVADYIQNSIMDAHRDGAAALIIRLDTPGGFLKAARRIVESLLNAPLPVIVYVAPSGAAAASAGAFVTEAAAIAAMAPGTTIGAAHPVQMGGKAPTGAYARKIENFAAAFARTIARERGRNENWMEAAVRRSATIGENEALRKHVIDIIAPDLTSLLSQASGRTVEVRGAKVVLELKHAVVRLRSMPAADSLLNTLADPNVMYLLMIGGLLGLYFEFAHPGVFLPGVAGAICFVLALTSFQVLPINVSGFLLLLFGVALLVAEVFVKSYGVFAIGGVAAFVLGSLMLINTSDTNLTISRPIIAGAAAAFAIAVLGLGYVLARDRRGRATTGSEGLVGKIGEVRESIAPGAPGHVFVHGEIWRASSEQTLTIGAQAQVMAVRGLELEVRPLKMPGRAGSADRLGG